MSSRRWVLAVALAILIGAIPAQGQVTYAQSTLNTSEFDFDIKNVTIDGAGNIHYYTLARVVVKVAADGDSTNLSRFGGTVIRGLIPTDPSTGTLASTVAL
ncbi:MAG: hypothetical protein CME19_12210 [Gemmatimonadetes bacterium]|nr:hypothetical protein [Gemmatimonadota bacterium]